MIEPLLNGVTLSMLKISDATTDDIPVIIDIAEKTWWPTYGQILKSDQIRYMLDTIYAPEAIARHISTRSQTFVLARDETGYQGFAAYGPRQDAKTYKLFKLYVLPQTQSKGYGRALIDEIKKRLLAAGEHTLDLNVNRNNPALLFYQKCGFELTGEEDIPIGPYWMNDYTLRAHF